MVTGIKETNVMLKEAKINALETGRKEAEAKHETEKVASITTELEEHKRWISEHKKAEQEKVAQLETKEEKKELPVIAGVKSKVSEVVPSKDEEESFIPKKDIPWSIPSKAEEAATLKVVAPTPVEKELPAAAPAVKGELPVTAPTPITKEHHEAVTQEVAAKVATSAAALVVEEENPAAVPIPAVVLLPDTQAPSPDATITPAASEYVAPSAPTNKNLVVAKALADEVFETSASSTAPSSTAEGIVPTEDLLTTDELIKKEALSIISKEPEEIKRTLQQLEQSEMSKKQGK